MATFFNASNSTFNHAERDLHIHTCINSVQSSLRELDPAPMDGTRSECLANTCMDILELIKCWIHFKPERVFWLYGVAGSGKSTLSTTIANLFRPQEQLGAFLFFNRDVAERSHPKYVIRTLAYQLGMFDPRIGVAIASVIQAIPTITQSSFRNQFFELLVKPLSTFPSPEGPIVLVLDALDECGSARDRRDLLAVLAAESAFLPPFVRFVITSRNEAEIRKAFTNQSHIFAHELDIASHDNFEDIKLFLRHRMQTICSLNEYLGLVPSWPDDGVIQVLAERAAGLFVWAATACRFIEDGHDPRERLDTLLQGDVNTNAESALDDLYAIALQSVGNWDDKVFCLEFRVIMGTILVARNPITIEVIDSLLRRPSKSLHLISKLGCVLRWSETEPVRILHLSFADYLTNQLRCGSETRYIDVGLHHRSLGIHCIDHLRGVLEHAYDHTQATIYATTSWIDHTCMVKDDTESIISALETFIFRHLLHWLAKMSALKKSRTAVELFFRLQNYLNPHISLESQLRELISDAICFMQTFASTIEEHPVLIYTSALPFAPVNTLLFRTFSTPGLPRIVGGYNTSWPQVLHVFNHGHEDRVLDVVFSPDGKRLISSSADGSIRVWDATSFEEALPPFTGHNGCVDSVAISSDGKWIVSGGEDCTVRLWDASRGSEMLSPLVGHTDYVRYVAFSPDGTRIVSGSADQTARVWNAISGLQITMLHGHTAAISYVSFSPDGTQIVSSSNDNSIRIWNSTSGALVQEPLECHHISVDISPDGRWLASCSQLKGGSELRIWDAATGVENQIIPVNEFHLLTIRFFPDGKRIAGRSFRHVHTCDIITGHHISSMAVHQGIGPMALSPNGDRVAVGLAKHHAIGIWSMEKDSTLPEATELSITKQPPLSSGQQAASMLRQSPSAITMDGHTDFISCITFSPDGNFVASGSHDKTICVWDTETGTQIIVLRGHEDLVECVAFSFDGRIVSGSSDCTVRLWNASSGEKLLPPLCGHKKYLVSVAFSPNGQQVASACWGKKLYIWDAITGARMRQLRTTQDALDLVQYMDDQFLHVFHHNDTKRTRGGQIWYIPGAFAMASHTGCLHSHAIMARISVHADGTIMDNNTQTAIARFPSMVSVTRYAVSETSIAFTSDDKWSTLFIMHLPTTNLIDSEGETQGSEEDHGNSEECEYELSNDPELEEDDGKARLATYGGEQVMSALPRDSELEEYDSEEDSEEEEEEEGQSGDEAGARYKPEGDKDDRGPGWRIEKNKHSGENICSWCHFGSLDI